MMKTKIFGLCAASMLFALGPLSANAVPILWTFSGATFDDGGIATGSFVYDADINAYSAIDITTTAGTTLGGATYTALSPGFPTIPVQLFAVPDASVPDLTGSPMIFPGFISLLSNAGGIVQISLGTGEAVCANASCSSAIPPVRFFNQGSQVIGTLPVSVPEPGTLSLLGFGLAGLGFIRRRKLRPAASV